MNIVTDINSFRALRGKAAGSVGFVPTMGNLHAGHASLLARARAENDVVVASVFVNPAQFDRKADFDAYARTPDEDRALLEKAGADIVLMPQAEDLYPDGYTLRVTETAEAEELEGRFRPGHFTGMLTVVMKLLCLVRPDRAYFGEKDFQQLLLVRKMAAGFFLPVDIVACPCLRDESGLALSSRNARLSAAGLAQAALIHALLSSPLPDAEVARRLDAAGFRTEYVETRWNRRLAAAWLEGVRLIDNVPLMEKENMEEKNAAVH